MTIRKGEPWGAEVARPTELLVVGSDRELAAEVARGSERPIGVAAGDVYAAVGSPAARDPVYLLPMDALRVEADGRSYLAVAHVLARRSWWRGRIVAVMNVGHRGTWNVAPRAHPNDGRMEVIEVAAAMTLRQRLQARARLEAGTHVPHPHIATRSVPEASWRFDRPMRVWVDGSPVGPVRDLRVAVDADAFAVHL